jgi:sugar phosphate isomerase/epimerase
VQFSSLSIEESCRRIAALGFTGVDIWSAYQDCPHLDDCLNRLGPEKLVELLKHTRLELTAFSTYVGGFAKYAHLLGQVGGGVAIQGSAAPCAPGELTVRMAQFLDELKPLADLAEETKSFLAIENHGNALLDSLDSFKAFTDLNESPRLGIALAPYHLQAIGASVPEAIRISGPQLLFFYAWQKAPGSQQLPGIGPTDFTPWLKALAENQYGGYVNPFMHGHPAPTEMSQALAQSKAQLEAWHPSKQASDHSLHPRIS